MSLAGVIFSRFGGGIQRGEYKQGFRSSPNFTWYNTGTITSSATASQSIEENVGSFTATAGAKSLRFYPFSNGLIKNNSDEDIEVWLNGDPRIAIPILNRETQDVGDIEIRSFTVKNMDGSTDISASEIYIILWNE